MTRQLCTPFTLMFVCALSLCSSARVAAQSAPAESSTVAAAAQQTRDDDAAVLDPAEPDFSLINLPTTLRLPQNRGDFHLTHRFNENLRFDDFSDQVQNLFGIDTGATISFEFRWGVMRRLEAVVQRTSLSRAIQFSAKYDAIHQSADVPVSVSGIVGVEGDDNFHRNRSPAIGVVVSRKFADTLAVYAEPFWVHNTAGEGTPNQNTGFVGLGARVRMLSTVYLVGEVSPRLGGFVIRDPAYGFAIEKRMGKHLFSATFTNTPGTTFRQLSLGGNPDTLTFGFNLTRKFF